MLSDLKTEVWSGEMEYHTYKGVGWFGIGGKEHPLFKTLINRILTESQYISDYKFYVSGGLLEDWVSWDIDLLIIGEFDSIKIKEVLEVMVRVGFELKLFVDPLWCPALWPQHLYSKYGGFDATYECYRLSNNFKRNGEAADLSHFEYVDGLYKQVIQYPFEKHKKRRSEGYFYKEPLLLN